MKDGEAGWTAVVRRRRKKSARSEDGDNSENWNVRSDFIKGRNLVKYKEVNGIPGIYIRGSLQASRWVAVKLARSHHNRTKVNQIISR